MRIVKGPCLIDIGTNPSPRASRRRAHKFNKTTETLSSKRSAAFYEKKRREFKIDKYGIKNIIMDDKKV